MAIGAAGIEPATSCSQSKHSTAELRTESIVKVRSLNHPYSIALFRARVKRENRTGKGGKPPIGGTAL